MKKKSVITLVLPFILVVLLISVSFAFFRSVTKVDKELVIGSLEIDYVESSEVRTSLKPIKEDEVLDRAYKLEFSISNINDVDIMSEVKLHINNISDNIKSDLKYKLYENDFELVDGDFTSSKTGEDLLLRDELYYEPGKTKNYVLYIYIEENNSNQNYVVGNNIDMKVVVEGKKITKTNMIKAYNGYESTDLRYFWIDEYKKNIKQVDFVDYINLDNAISLSNGTGDNYWDLSSDSNESIIAWLESDENNMYHLYIGTNQNYIFASNCASLFQNFDNVTEINFGKIFRTDNVKSIAYMFGNCKALKRLDLKYFDTDNVVSMVQVFRYCNSLEELNIESFNTSDASNMEFMFSGCSSLLNLDVSKFITTKSHNMQGMFSGCSLLTSLDVSNFDTSNVTTMYAMFSECSSLIILDVSDFVTSSVTIMRGMFYNCLSLTELDVSNFDTSNVETFQSMFNGCRALTRLDVSSFNTSNATNMNLMFYYCESLKNINVTNFNTSNVTTMQGMFGDCYSLTRLNVSSFDTSNVTTMYGMFYNCSSLKELNVTNFDTSSVTNMQSMFGNCTSLTELDLSSFVISNVTNKLYMFVSTYNIVNAYAKDEESANFFNNDTNKPSSYEFVVK